jgi:long-chain acyl-CoA synthetase
MATGSAPIDKNVLAFLKIALCVPILEGYGQTETAAALCFTLPDENEPGHVGGPLQCVDLKLEDVKEMNYTSKDEVNGQPMPRGEICVKGPSVFKGYFKAQDKTAETIDAQGWMHTGDIGTILPNGAVKIIDRKKNIFKLSQGEYIAPEKLENVYAKSPLIAQIFVYGDSLQSILVTIVVPDEEEVKKWAASRGLSGDFQTVSKSDDLKKALNEELIRLGKENKFNGLEFPKKMHVSSELFSAENNTLTPTFKLKRNEAKIMYLKEIKSMYDGAKLQGEDD